MLRWIKLHAYYDCEAKRRHLAEADLPHALQLCRPEGVVRVRCGGKLHRISVSRKWRLALHDHTAEDISRHLAFEALGGKSPCRCVQVLTDFRRCAQGESRRTLPAGLRDAARTARLVHEARERLGPRPADVLALPQERRPLYLGRMLDRKLEGSGLNCVVAGPSANGHYGVTLRMGQAVLLETTFDQRLAEGLHSNRMAADLGLLEDAIAVGRMIAARPPLGPPPHALRP